MYIYNAKIMILINLSKCNQFNKRKKEDFYFHFESFPYPKSIKMIVLPFAKMEIGYEMAFF